MVEQKPKRRWFQYPLKTLMLLPVIVGLPLGLYHRRQRSRKFKTGRSAKPNGKAALHLP